MTEHGETDSRIDEYIEELRKKAEHLRVAVEFYDSQVELLIKQKELLLKYGAQIPMAMQATQFMIEQIAATSEQPPSGKSDGVKIGGRVTTIRPRRRRATPKEKGGAVEDKKYNIAPQVKPIMNAIFGKGKEQVPETVDTLFDKMYPNQDWRTEKIILVSKGIGLGHRPITYGDDLNSDDSYIRRLIRGADGVINTRMRNNNLSSFTFQGKVAATELIQLYHTIDSVGWNIYDGFMIRNRVRQT